MSKPFTVREDDQSDKAKMIRAAFEAAFSESENMVKSTDNIPKNIPMINLPEEMNRCS